MDQQLYIDSKHQVLQPGDFILLKDQKTIGLFGYQGSPTRRTLTHLTGDLVGHVWLFEEIHAGHFTALKSELSKAEKIDDPFAVAQPASQAVKKAERLDKELAGAEKRICVLENDVRIASKKIEERDELLRENEATLFQVRNAFKARTKEVQCQKQLSIKLCELVSELSNVDEGDVDE